MAVPLFLTQGPGVTAALPEQMQKCAHKSKSDAQIQDGMTNDVYETLVAERSQDAEALAAEDADNAYEQQLPNHRTSVEPFRYFIGDDARRPATMGEDTAIAMSATENQSRSLSK